MYRGLEPTSIKLMILSFQFSEKTALQTFLLRKKETLKLLLVEMKHRPSRTFLILILQTLANTKKLPV